MRRRARADKNYKFTEKRHSGVGTMAFVLSFVPLLLFFYAVYISFLRGGQAPEKIGCVGIGAVVFAFLTLYVSEKPVRKIS